MYYQNYKKYKSKYKLLKAGNIIPSIIYKSLILSRFCYEPPVLYLLALGIIQDDFNNIGDNIELNKLPIISEKINREIDDIYNKTRLLFSS